MNKSGLERYSELWDRVSDRRAWARDEGGKEMLRVRQALGLSLRGMAVRLEVSASYLSKVERGVEVMSPALAKKVLELDASNAVGKPALKESQRQVIEPAPVVSDLTYERDEWSG